jgi:hypothetical protein
MRECPIFVPSYDGPITLKNLDSYPKTIGSI